jgi:glycosyltransferase 2 family protein
LMVVPILWVIVMIPITIGNIGLQDVGYVMLMGLVGVPAAAALTMSLVEHLVVRLVILPGIFYVGTIKG